MKMKKIYICQNNVKKLFIFFLILEYIYDRLINRIKGGVRDGFP